MAEGYCLRPRKRQSITQDDGSVKSDSPDSDHFRAEDEARAWDAFYIDQKSDKPFSGFNTKATVSMVRACLRRIRSPPLINDSDVVLEVGHGKHPLLWDLKRSFGTFHQYIGIEFSRCSIHEAIKLRHRESGKDPSASMGDNVEFLWANSVNYFKPDGSCTADVLHPSGREKPWLHEGSVTLMLAKSTLDYITCRLTGSVDVMEWKDHPRIAPSVVEMFDSFSLALGNASSDRSPVVIFVEPGDFVKFRDHIATIVRVIYAASFHTKSPAKWLRLTRVNRHKNYNAICYVLEKTREVYKSYDDLRVDIYRVTAGLYDLSAVQDDDWLLPTSVPPKWKSMRSCDLEQLSAI